MRVTIRETGEVLQCSPVPVGLAMPKVLVDGRELPVSEALGILQALRDYWRARAMRFETELGDLRANQPVDP